MSDPPDDRIAALGEELRVIAARGGRLRRRWYAGACVLIGLVVLARVLHAPAAVLVLFIALLVLGSLTCPLWAALPEWSVKQKVRALTPERQIATLAPLLGGPQSDARRIAGELLRGLHLREDALLGPVPRQRQLAEIQRRICKAGRRVDTVATAVWFLCLTSSVAIFGWAELMHAAWLTPQAERLLLLAFICCSPLALASRVVVRMLFHRRLLPRLAGLTPEQQAEVLLPLRGALTDETRRLVEPLVREFRLGTELAPVAPPEGRGDEPVPEVPR